MASLEINGVAYDVVSDANYSTSTTGRSPLRGIGGGVQVMPTAPYIEATIRIGATQRSTFNPPSDVRLVLDNGRSAYGIGLWDTAYAAVHGDVRFVRFEGKEILEK